MGDIWFKIDKDDPPAERTATLVRNLYVLFSLIFPVFAVIHSFLKGESILFPLAFFNFLIGMHFIIPLLIRLTNWIYQRKETNGGKDAF